MSFNFQDANLELGHSPSVWVGSLRVLQLSPTVQRNACEVCLRLMTDGRESSWMDIQPGWIYNL